MCAWLNEVFLANKEVIDQVDTDACSSSKHGESVNGLDDQICNSPDEELNIEVFDYENSNDDYDLSKRILRRLSYLDDYVTELCTTLPSSVQVKTLPPI
jgi:hypothetical protein